MLKKQLVRTFNYTVYDNDVFYYFRTEHIMGSCPRAGSEVGIIFPNQ